MQLSDAQYPCIVLHHLARSAVIQPATISMSISSVKMTMDPRPHDDSRSLKPEMKRKSRPITNGTSNARHNPRSSYGERLVSAGPNIVMLGHGVPSLLQVATIQIV